MKAIWKALTLAALLLLPCLLLAQTTTVTTTFTDPAGDLVSGSCSFQAVGSFTSAGGNTVIGSPVVVSFTSGAFSAALTPTDTAVGSQSPPQKYKVQCIVPPQTVSGRAVQPFSWGPQYCTVPTSSAPITWAAMSCTGTVPTPSMMLQPWQVLATGLPTGEYSWGITSGTVTGLVPATGGSEAVASVFGRTGPVLGMAGDYTAAQVTNAAATNASNTFTAGTQDFSGAAHTRPTIVIGTVANLPATCAAGELAFVIGATAGQQIYECSTANVWTQQTGGGGGGALVCPNTITIPSTALTLAASSQSMDTGILIPLNATVTLARIVERNQFSCTGSCVNISAMTVSLGRTGAAQDYTPAWAIMQTPSNTHYFATSGALGSTMAASEVLATFTVTNGSPGNLGNGTNTTLTGGSVDVEVCYVP